MSDVRFLDVRGDRLEACFVGASPPGAPTLVFLHEGLGSVAQWKDFPAEVCARTGLGALVYSRRGYGASSPVPAAPRDVRFMHDEAYDVLPAVLDAAKLSSVVLVGHSDGASIALLHAARDGGARVRAVAALAPHLFVEDVTVKSIAALAATWKTTDLRDRLARYHGANVDGAFLGWSGVWLDPRFRAWNIEREVAHVRAAVLVVQGEDDEYGTLAQVAAVEKAVHGPKRSLVLPKCGHSPHKDRPRETCEAIAALLDMI
jgi:pimeloyl-ACP methyl ester carboxylesterase